MPTLQTPPQKVKIIPLASIDKVAGFQGKPVPLPVVNMHDMESEYIIYITMPGMRREHLGITLKQDVLTITAGMRQNDESLDDRCSYDYTGWSRSFQLPEDSDPIMTTAGLRNGELVIHIPKGTDKVMDVSHMIHVY